MFSRLLSFSEYFDYLYYTVYSCPCYHLVIKDDTRMMDGGLLDNIISVIPQLDKFFTKTHDRFSFIRACNILARRSIDRQQSSVVTVAIQLSFPTPNSSSVSSFVPYARPQTFRFRNDQMIHAPSSKLKTFDLGLFTSIHTGSLLAIGHMFYFAAYSQMIIDIF